ncbi:hypothetical protein OTU49_016910 [Cherax quadricarinatus]|uniref:Uncharacterized protein n=1 Tax=Cherax quadricarinatus TaxID=27406 RepID=A0AAW0Y5N5_CHEQU
MCHVTNVLKGLELVLKLCCIACALKIVLKYWLMLIPIFVYLLIFSPDKVHILVGRIFLSVECNIHGNLSIKNVKYKKALKMQRPLPDIFKNYNLYFELPNY